MQSICRALADDGLDLVKTPRLCSEEQNAARKPKCQQRASLWYAPGTWQVASRESGISALALRPDAVITAPRFSCALEQAALKPRDH